MAYSYARISLNPVGKSQWVNIKIEFSGLKPSKKCLQAIGIIVDPKSTLVLTELIITSKKLIASFSEIPYIKLSAHSRIDIVVSLSPGISYTFNLIFSNGNITGSDTFFVQDYALLLLGKKSFPSGLFK